MPALTLWQREMVRFFRQRNRVVSTMATPLVFWLIIGSGFSSSFVASGSAQGGSAGYMAYFFPGTVMLMLMFAAIFSTISVIEDRREGFLQTVMVAPMPRVALVMGKVLGGASVATIMGIVFLAFWPLIGTWPGWVAAAGTAGVMFLVAIELTAFGLLLAWPMESTAGFHGVMNLLLMPMWFLSGAMFPITHGWQAWIKVVNPLTYAQNTFVGALRGEMMLTDLLLTVGFTIITIAAAVKMISRPRKDGS